MFATAKQLIVGDRDLCDEYIADLIDVKHEPHNVNPVVRVRFVLKYPIQHAIIWPDVTHENSPVQEGAVCRLSYIRDASAEEVRRFCSYQESLLSAQQDALKKAVLCNDKASAEIILRHMRGEYRAPRVLISYKRWEL